MNVAGDPLKLRKVGLIERAADAERAHVQAEQRPKLARFGEMVRIIAPARSSAGLTPVSRPWQTCRRYISF
jgi:hypothetical protein